MEALNLPAYESRIKKGKGRFDEIWDPLRKRYVALTPEEWVRQHILNFLTKYRGYPTSLIRVEVSLNYNQLRKRSDIVVFDRNGNALLLVECKGPGIILSEDVLYQVIMYNRNFTGKFLLLTNGLTHIPCKVNATDQTIEFLREIPEYCDLLKEYSESLSNI